MPPPTREEVMAELVRLPPDQHKAFLAEVERRMQGEIRAQRPTEKPLWQFDTPMAFGQEGPSVEDALGWLPTAGGVVGGMVGGGAGLPSGGLAVPAMAAGGAAAGGAIGKGLENVGRWAVGAPISDPMTQAVDMTKEAALQGGQELIGQGVGRVLQGAASPGRASLDPAMVAAQERLLRAPGGAGLELPASSLTKSRPVAYLEGAAAEGWGGAGTADRYRGAASRLTAIADHTVARASAAADDTSRGEAIERGFQAFRQGWMQTKNSLYRDAETSMPDFKTALPETVQMLRRIVADKTGAKRVGQAGPAADSGFYDGLLEGLTKTVERPTSRTLPGQTLMGAPTDVPVMGQQSVLRNVQAKDIQRFLKELQAKVQSAYSDPFASGNKGQLLALKKTMTREYERALGEASPEIGQKFADAKAAYQAGISKINSSFGKSIVALAREGKYDKLAQAVVSPRMSVSQIPVIKEVVGQEGTEAMQASALASLVAQASTHAEGGELVLTAKGLDAAGKRFGWDRLKALLTPEQYQRYMDLMQARGSMQRGERVIFGSPTAGKAAVAGYKGIATEGLKSLARPFIGGGLVKTAAGPGWGIAYILGDVGMNKFIGTKVGQKWLTEGFPRVGKVAGAIGRQVPRVMYETYDAGEDE